MADEQHLNFQLQRQPFGEVPTDDVPRLRAFLLSNLGARVVLGGRLPAALQLFGEGFAELGDLPRADDPLAEPLLARIFFLASRRPEIRRRMRVGEILLRTDEGLMRHAAVVEIELAAEADAPEAMGWWAAWRRIGVGVDAGVLLGEWEERQGVGLQALPEPLRDWFDVGTSEVQAFGMDVKPQTESQAGMQWTRGSLGEPLPEDLTASAAALLQWAAPLLLGRKVRVPLVIAVRGAQLDRFELVGDLAASIHDLARTLAARVLADTVALVMPAVFSIDGDHRPGWALVVERDGRRVQAGFAKPRPGDTSGQSNGYLNDLGEVPEDQRWLGVEPSVTIDIPGLMAPVTVGEA